MADEDNKQDSKPDGGNGDSKYIKLKVGENEIIFKVKMSTKLGKLKITYSERMGVPKTALRFLFDGDRVGDDDTPMKLKMENDDVIEVHGWQDGGAGMKI